MSQLSFYYYLFLTILGGKMKKILFLMILVLLLWQLSARVQDPNPPAMTAESKLKPTGEIPRDWPHPIKWDQMDGIDGYSGASFICNDGPADALTADDFECTETGWITDIHFAGYSYYGSMYIDKFRVTFWSDFPATPDDESHPDVLLADITVTAANLADPLKIGWTELTDGTFRINLPGQDWFYQEGTEENPIIYWIGIQGVMVDDGYEDYFYWNFRDRYITPWNDDAAFYSNSWGYPPWYNWGWESHVNDYIELYDGPFPTGWDSSADMAFRLSGIAEDSETKFEQPPDLTPNGIDVHATADMYAQEPPHILADDFLCTTTGNITDIHIWGSWLSDIFPYYESPEECEFTLSIHADIPATGQDFSRPGDVLWYKTLQTYDIEWFTDVLEDWYDPYTGQWLDDNHYTCIKYNFYLDEEDYFMQTGTPEEPVVYWLDVQAKPLDPNTEDARFGWKTSYEHWNDDAVWGIGSEPFMGPWNELIYPIGHEYQGESIDLAFAITTESEPTDEYDLGDAPEGENAIAYPSLSVLGSFPTCITIGPSGYIQHGFGDNLAWFGQTFDLENDGNAGFCPACFPPYDQDECFNDGDAGLMFPEPFTIDSGWNVIPCPMSLGTSLGIICQTAVWGVDIDIIVNNNMPVIGYVNVLFDWNQDGFWQYDPNTQCPGVMTPEHVLVDYQIPVGFSGQLSALLPPGFIIGPNFGYVWSRFSITEQPVVTNDWDGSGVFEDGETEDYLILVEDEPQPELDYGDCPDPTYPTLLANDGARHIIVAGAFMGILIDGEANGFQDPNALGDDNNNLDDEDGVSFTGPIVPGENVSVLINVSSNGFINAWLDYDIDGGWAEANDFIINNQPVAAGNNTFNISIPFTATSGPSFTRFRFDTVGGLSYTGLANDGEVEDYKVKIEELDFGDADDPTYPTYYASNGARHMIDGYCYLGASVDSDLDGQPDGLATGDDNDGNDDEDGVLFVTPLIPAEQGAIYVLASMNGYLNAWIDYDQSGTWDPGEQIYTDLWLNTGWNPLTFMIPASANYGQTSARFRFDSTGGLAVTGLAYDGEVEDYLVIIEEAPDDGIKMHYHQWPDTTWFGIDVCATYDYEIDRILADDFLCTETGPINSIHFWGSYWYDYALEPLFELGIWSDNPMGENGWSEPDLLLWSRDFMPGEYDCNLYLETTDGEHWYDPCTGNLQFPGDYFIWEYDFTIPNEEAFFQEDDTIYWLSVRALFEDEAYFGWKTSPNHWNDDAVYQCMFPARQWMELTYPYGHPFNPNGEEHISMDMAFYIDCHPQTPQNVIITEDGTNVTLQWDPSWCTAYYNVYSSTDPYAAFPSGWTLEPTGTQIPGTSWSEALGSMKFYRVTAER